MQYLTFASRVEGGFSSLLVMLACPVPFTFLYRRTWYPAFQAWVYDMTLAPALPVSYNGVQCQPRSALGRRFLQHEVASFPTASLGVQISHDPRNNGNVTPFFVSWYNSLPHQYPAGTQAYSSWQTGLPSHRRFKLRLPIQRPGNYQVR